MPGASIGGELTRVVTAGQEALTASIDNLELPFQDELEKYVVVSDDLFTEWMAKIKGLLNDLRNLNVTYATLLLDPTQYNDAYSSSVLTQLSSVILTNLTTLGSGLPTATEQAIYDRATTRVNLTASRVSRRIINDVSKRLPYSGMLADLLIEADRDAQRELTDIARDVAFKQADLAYKNQIDKIQLAISNETMNLTAFEQRRDRALKAYTVHDQNEIIDHWKYFEYTMNRAIGYARLCGELIKLFANGADQLTFENWLAMSKLMSDGQLRIGAMVAQLLPSSQSV